MKEFIVIPAYNEERKIGEVLENLKSEGYENIVVVDDGSKDNTSQIASKYDVNIIKHPINRGQGAALRTGTTYALNNNASIIVHFDADGQMRPEDISTLLHPIRTGKAEIAFGSRFLSKQSNIPILRKLFLKAGRVFMRVIYGVSMTDPQSGFRALSATAAQQIQITQRGMAHCSEIIEEVHKKQIPFREVPVVIKYTEYSVKHGQSNLAAFQIAAKLLWRRIVR